jgi:hypothetical protein
MQEGTNGDAIMKMVHNTTRQPVRIPMPGGKVLHLGPDKNGQISDHALEAPAVKRLLDAGTIEVLEEDHAAGEGAGASGERPHESTHGFPQPTVVTPRGNR